MKFVEKYKIDKYTIFKTLKNIYKNLKASAKSVSVAAQHLRFVTGGKRANRRVRSGSHC